MTPEMFYNAVLGLLISIGWYWVRSIDKKQDEDKLRMDRIEERMRREYQLREDAKRDSDRLYDTLKDIKAQITRLGDKIDQKADK